MLLWMLQKALAKWDQPRKRERWREKLKLRRRRGTQVTQLEVATTCCFELNLITKLSFIQWLYLSLTSLTCWPTSALSISSLSSCYCFITAWDLIIWRNCLCKSLNSSSFANSSKLLSMRSELSTPISDMYSAYISCSIFSLASFSTFS